MRSSSLALLAALLAQTSSPGVTVTVEVSAFRNREGKLGCRLFSSPEGFPTGTNSVGQLVPITGTTTRCEFTAVTPGTYAVSVLHDENNNGRLDTGLFGMPTEGYGASNNRTRAMGPPRWEDSTFVIEAGKPVTLAVTLRY